MKRKSLIALVAMLTLILSSLTGCRKYEQIRITACKIESVSMNGFKSLDLNLNVGMENPAGKIIIQSAEGTLKHFGKVIGKVTLAPLTINPRSSSCYPAKAHVELASGLSLKQILTLADPAKLEECTIDIDFAGKAAGVAIKKKIEDVPLKKLLESTKNEKI